MRYELTKYTLLQPFVHSISTGTQVIEKPLCVFPITYRFSRRPREDEYFSSVGSSCSSSSCLHLYSSFLSLGIFLQEDLNYDWKVSIRFPNIRLQRIILAHSRSLLGFFQGIDLVFYPQSTYCEQWWIQGSRCFHLSFKRHGVQPPALYQSPRLCNRRMSQMQVQVHIFQSMHPPTDNLG
ncbi:hypothetical protein BDD12DRAFT_12621 [Trichophaea hybrida]|nr:hypothetical protein BDD12DRAFT_12621 [Trichophaea hybrida]